MQTTQQQIKGTVSDANGVLTGVTVTIKGKPINTITNENGQFTIAAAEGDVLVFSFMGYEEVAVSVSTSSVINLTMQEVATTLKEVVVNAGYYTVKDKERTGSIAKLSAKDIAKQPVTNVLAAMQGRMAGVEITQETGVPGGGFAIKIRGINSLRADGNTPLYVIDGVPYSTETVGASQTSTVTPTATVSPLSNINPSDIESIEVLKDADATAIYGSRGANGVVLITTKKGKAGKTTFNVNASSGWGKVTRFFDLMNTEQYLKMRRQAFINDGITTYPATAYDVNGTWDQNRYTDWQQTLLGGTAEISNVQASVSGGTGATQFLAGVTHYSEGTVFKGDFIYRKTNVHFNINHQSENKRFRFSLTGGYTVQNNNQPATDFTREAVSLAPNAPSLYNADGSLNWENNTFNNPLRNLETKYKTKSGDFVANTLLSYQLLEGLEVKSSFGFTDLRFAERRILPSTMFNPSLGLTSASSAFYLNTTNRQSWIVEPQVTYKKAFGKAKFDFLLGGTFQDQTNYRMVERGVGFTSNSLIENMAAAKTRFVYGNEQTEYKYQAFFGRLNFNWDKKYLLNLTGRRDGSSRFGPGNQFAVFGAFGAAWLFGNEDWIQAHVPFLSFGKLRASYGTAGNDQIGDYQFLDTYSLSSSTYQGTTGLDPTRLFNPNFGWESNTKLEIALETGFVNDRIFLTTAYYSNRSSNQLVGIPLPGTTGFTSLQANLDATVENSGLELTLRTETIAKKDFTWSTSFNLTVPRNKLISFPGLSGSTYANQYVVGSSVNIKKLYQSTGVNPLTGLYGFTDFNGDGIISSVNDRQIIKDFNPKYYGGLQNTITYKGLQLDFLFQFVKQENWNWTYLLGLPGIASNMSAEAVNSWSQAGNVAPYQLFTTGVNSAAVAAYYNYIQSDKAVVDASYVRLKNVSLSYQLPKNWTKGLDCKLSLQGQNLLIITPYKGADPEFTIGGYLPPLRIITVGAQFNF
ncbi:SusC/RagA family TonB-linked outer membrane protein [Flavobacterium sp.]|uniref:SusC/RagA family TonB-linked outer membrane protein n=1 Tax=Flavobacterium sp. TaxID=239 RepID=UPI003751D6C6